jgi:hypothetical protein
VQARPEPGGWTIFAAVVLLIVGALNALWGLAAVLNGDVLAVGGRGVIVWNFTAWGWIHLIVGASMVVIEGDHDERPQREGGDDPDLENRVQGREEHRQPARPVLRRLEPDAQ